ncbi:MAG: hypothetical protein WA667_00010 [Candidatus Nitrosopolaris sp.]
MEKQDIISVLDLVKHNQLQTLQWKVGNLRYQIDGMTNRRGLGLKGHMPNILFLRLLILIYGVSLCLRKMPLYHLMPLIGLKILVIREITTQFIMLITNLTAEKTIPYLL